MTPKHDADRRNPMPHDAEQGKLRRDTNLCDLCNKDWKVLHNGRRRCADHGDVAEAAAPPAPPHIEVSDKVTFYPIPGTRGDGWTTDKPNAGQAAPRLTAEMMYSLHACAGLMGKYEEYIVQLMKDFAEQEIGWGRIGITQDHANRAAAERPADDPPHCAESAYSITYTGSTEHPDWPNTYASVRERERGEIARFASAVEAQEFILGREESDRPAVADSGVEDAAKWLDAHMECCMDAYCPCPFHETRDAQERVAKLLAAYTADLRRQRDGYLAQLNDDEVAKENVELRHKLAEAETGFIHGVYEGTRKDWMNRAQAAEHSLAQAREALRQTEWGRFLVRDGVFSCPACHAEKKYGHSGTCPVRAALAKPLDK